jgi:hypothetical protein
MTGVVPGVPQAATLLVLLMVRVLLRGLSARGRHGQRLEAQPADVAEVGGRGVVP